MHQMQPLLRIAALGWLSDIKNVASGYSVRPLVI